VHLLIDTHALMWWREDSPQLSPRARREIADPDNEIFVSVVTLWEIILKRSAGRLNFPDDLEQVLREDSFTLMPINFHHLRTIERLPFLHKDPFDRMLIAQATAEGIPLITKDRGLSRYGIALLW
jgi:PIN domain nuclease of toxin-antitoxin system